MTSENRTKRLDDSSPQSEREAAIAEERIPPGGLAAVMAAQAEKAIPEERIPEGGLAGLKAREERKPLVRAVGLTKSFLGTLALSDFSLTLYPGEILGLVGPNGAGKTTLLRILATLTQPDSGEATICGYSLGEVKKIRGLIGFMPDVLGVYDDMLVLEYLEFFARACGLPEEVRPFAIEETLKVIGLAHVAEQPVDGLSRGMKQRLALGRSILHNPKLLLLDEPASGLDPLARLELREILRRLQNQGATVVISSHVLEDLADMCDRIAVVSKGRSVLVDKTERLIQQKGSRRMRLRAHSQREKLYDYLNTYEGLTGLRWDNECVVFQMEGATEKEVAGLLRSTVEAGIDLISFQEEKPSLESAYLNVTQGGSGWEAGI